MVTAYYEKDHYVTKIGDIDDITPTIPEVIERSKKDVILDYISKVASVVYNRDGVKNKEKRFNALLTEAYGGTPSSVFEFIPCEVEYKDADIILKLATKKRKFYTVGDDGVYHTNLRELLEVGVELDKVIEYVSFNNFSTFKITAPYFIFGQLSRHKTCAVISHSQRYADAGRNYWYPHEFQVFMLDGVEDADDITDEDIQHEWNYLVENLSPLELKKFMKEKLGIKRKEVWDRGIDMLQYRTFCIGGTINVDEKTGLEWLVRQRTDDHTQLETKVLVEQLAVAYLGMWDEI